MKNNSFLTELGVSALFVAVTACFFTPLQTMWMPSMIHSFFLIGLVVVFCIFSVFVWKERALDEREEQQRLVAGRIGFLAGAGLLVVGIINQTINHELDSWLLIALTGMVIAKLVTRLYMHLRD
jgi:hypothetical protein